MSNIRKIPEYDWDFEESIESDDGESIIHSTVITVKKPCVEEDIPFIIEDFVTKQAQEEADCIGASIDDYDEYIHETTFGIVKSAVVDIEKGTIEFDWIEPNEDVECVGDEEEEDIWGPGPRGK